MNNTKGQCPLCKTTDTLLIVKQKINSLMQCRSCGLLYRYPIPTIEYYKTLNDNVAYSWYGEFDLAHFDPACFKKTNQYFQIRRRLKYINRYKTTGNLLDIGCGLGLFVWEANRCGFSAMGIDTSQKAVKWAQETLNVNSKAGRLEDMEFSAEQFDIITMWHVLEHMPDPAGTLRYLRRLIKSNGYIFVELPNVAALEIKFKNLLSKCRLKRNPWGHFTMPEHLYEFTPATFRRLAASANFKILDWTTLSSKPNPLWGFLCDKFKIEHKALFVLMK